MNENHRAAIAKIVTNVAKTRPAAIPADLDSENLPWAIQTLQLCGHKKPFFVNAEKFVTAAVLTRPELFDLLAKGIHLYAHRPTNGISAWSGDGRLKNIGIGGKFTFSSYQPDASFIMLNIDSIYSELEQFLEKEPDQPLTTQQQLDRIFQDPLA